MVAVPYVFNEIYDIFRNAPFYTVCLELSLLLAVIWLIFYKNKSGRKRQYSKEEQEEIIRNWTPEPLVGDTPSDHQALYPRIVTSRVGKRITVDGHDCLNVGTHNYLGLLGDGEIENSALKSLRKYGVGSCGPRGFYGTLDVHLELEERLAKFMEMEEAVVYSYGFSTIASAIPAYSKRVDIIFADEQVNFSIQKGIDASRSTVYYYKHNDMKDLERLLMEQQKRDEKNPKKAARTRRFLVAEGIYMNTGEICPLPELVELRKKYKLRLFLDESISFGTLGANGRGLTEHFNIDRIEVDLISAGLEWAVGSIGGFCVGSSFIVEHQRLSGLGYCFSASLPPLLTQAAICALDRFENDPKIFVELRKRCQKLHSALEKLSNMTLRGSDISPVKHLYLKESKNQEKEREILKQIVDKCIENGVAVIDAQYLDGIEKHCPRYSIRVTANRLLEDKDIEQVFEVLEKSSKLVLA